MIAMNNGAIGDGLPSSSGSTRGDLNKLAAMTAEPPQLHYWDATQLASA